MSPDSLEIDRHFDGVGRLKKRIGSTSAALRRKYNRMLDNLKDEARTDLIRAIKLDQLTFAEVYEAWVRNRLDQLPVGETAVMLVTAMQNWLDSLIVGDGAGADCSEKHHRSMLQTLTYLKREMPDARLADLPAVLERLRNSLGAKHPTSFNHARSHASKFVRATLKTSHPLYNQVRAVEARTVRERDRYQGNPLSVEQLLELFPNRETDDVAAIVWSQATTGMHEKEYWGEWSAKADRVRIGGTKRPRRMRDVPLVLVPAVPRMHPRTFANAVRDRTNGFIEPYDLRRTYANALEAAGITRIRRKMYLGHSAGDVTALYERHEVDRFLVEDAAKLRAFFGLPDPAPQRLTLEKHG